MVWTRAAVDAFRVERTDDRPAKGQTRSPPLLKVWPGERQDSCLAVCAESSEAFTENRRRGDPTLEILSMIEFPRAKVFREENEPTMSFPDTAEHLMRARQMSDPRPV